MKHNSETIATILLDDLKDQKDPFDVMTVMPFEAEEDKPVDVAEHETRYHAFLGR